MNVKHVIHASLCAALLFVVGCATERAMTTSSVQYAATDPKLIKIYQTGKPTSAYDEIGRVSIDKYNNMAIARSGDVVFQLMREKAAAIGGDAIMGVTEDFASMSGVVIKFKTAAQ